MDHAAVRQSGSRHPHSTTQLISSSLQPLPCSGSALSVAFYTTSPPLDARPSPTVRASKKNQSSKPSASEFLTRTFLQQDENCQESSDLHPLLGTIFAYSDQCSSPSWSSEDAAGYRYFLPNGRLAYEWVYFFAITPDRYLEWAPPDVFQAYQQERYYAPTSMRGWVEDSIYQAEITEADTIAQDFIQDLELVATSINGNSVLEDPTLPAPQTLSRKRKQRSHIETTDDVVYDSTDPLLLPPPAKRTRIVSNQTTLTSYAVNSVAGALSTVQSGVAVTSTVPGLSHPGPNDTSGRTAAPIRLAAATSLLRPATSMATAQSSQVVHASPNVLPLPPQPAPTSRSIPHKRQAQNHPAPSQAPGSVTRAGRGNVLKAWSADRIRAFTTIQGHSQSELPLTAVSPYGDEMSRGHAPKTIDPRCCPFDTTMEELLTYMTLATTSNRELCARAKRHWTAQQMVFYVYYALGLRTRGTYDRTRLQKQFEKCVEGFENNNPHHVSTATMSNLCTDNGLNGDDKDTHDYFLHAMGKNVVHHPTGRAAQMLTRVIRHVLQTGDQNVRLSQAAQYAQTHGITVPLSERMSSDLSVADRPDPVTLATARASWVAKFPGGKMP